MNMNVIIPDGLGDLLRDFTVAVLRQKPKDLFEFAADWFVYTRDTHRMRSIPMYIIADDDDEGEVKDPVIKPKVELQGGRAQRRHSVSAERYDPEADTEEDVAVVHPKSETQQQRLRETIKGILLFKSLDQDQIQRVVDAMFERKVQPAEKVIVQGEDGDNFYVIEKGSYDVIATTDGDEKRVFRFEGSGSFGELALMYNMPRSATIEAVDQGTLWAMDRGSFRSIVMKSAFKKRKMYEALIEGVPILQTLEKYERMNLADALTTRNCTDGECVIKQGDEAEGMYFVESGEVKITVLKDGKEMEVLRSGKGKYFGEAELVDKKPRTASVYAVGAASLAFLEKDSFERLLGSCIKVMRKAMASYKTVK